MSRHGACRVAASVLTKVALERGSRDNITVIVVDITLQPTSIDEEGTCVSHVVPSSYPGGSVNDRDGDEDSGEPGPSKTPNPNNHSVGTHLIIKSRASDGGDAGVSRKHSAGEITTATCNTRCGLLGATFRTFQKSILSYLYPSPACEVWDADIVLIGSSSFWMDRHTANSTVLSIDESNVTSEKSV